MITQEIYNYVVKRAGKLEVAEFFEEINRALGLFEHQLDNRDSLQEMDLSSSVERQVTLPWFVLSLKGARDCGGVPVKLMTPRPAYNQSGEWQSDYDWRNMHRTPLFQPLAATGRLTIRPRKKLLSPVTINLRGPGDFGVTEIEPVVLAANTLSAESTSVFSDLTCLSKSTMTAADIEIYDIQNNQVGLLPADQTDVWCQLIALVDRHHGRFNINSQNYYTVLFKRQPARISTMTDAVPTEFGMIIQDMLIESLLGARVEEQAQKVSSKFGNKAGQNADNILSKHAEPMITKINTGRSPYMRCHRGYL